MAYNNVTNKIKICKKEKKLTGEFSFYKQFFLSTFKIHLFYFIQIIHAQNKKLTKYTAFCQPKEFIDKNDI